MRISPAGLITTLLAVVLLFALAGYQVTGRTAGARLLGRAGAAMIELDRWLPAHRDDINLLSRDRPTAPLVLPDLPIEVSIPSAAAIDSSDQSLRAAITRAMGEKLYVDGSSAVHDEDGDSHFSITEPVRWTINLLGDGAHSFWRFGLILSGLLLLALCAGMLWTRQSPLLPVAAGGAIAAALSLVAWFLAILSQSLFGGALDKEIALALRDGAWIGLRNGLAAVAMSLGALYVLSTLFGPRDGWREDDEEAWPDAYEAAGHDRRRQSPPY